MTLRRSLLASLIAMSGLTAPAFTISGRPRAVPPTRSRQSPKGMRYSGGTGELKTARSKAEHVRRIEAAQAKRERRMERNRRLAGFA